MFFVTQKDFMLCNNMYSIVIPIKQYTYFWSSEGHIDERQNTPQHDNIKRFFEISWISHDKNLNKNDIDCIFFIVSSDEKDYLESFVKKNMYNVKTNIIVEDEILSPKYDFQSHRKQMLLKLLIYKYINTALYLILDDDIISLKSFGYNDLFHSGKVKYAAEHSIESQPHVWECSRDLLKLKQKTNIYKLRDTMSVTPQIMITPIVKDMMNYLLKVHGSYEKMYQEMARTSWTEYTLYWLYLQYVDKRGPKYYYKSNSMTTTNLMTYDKNFINIIKDAIREKTNYFMIIQSNVYEYKLKDLKNAIKM
jgi:hypothetical protein